jgi:peptidoglycan hydrolase-like protein with peptidoglycan-binding domain
MNRLVNSVGSHQPNRSEDVLAVQAKLNGFVHETRRPLLRIDGHCGPATLSAIRSFQKIVVGMPHPDGIVAINGPTWAILADRSARRLLQKARATTTSVGGSTAGLSDADFQAAADRLGPGVSPLLVRAFAEVESGGKSGFGADRRPIVAFEGHWFRKLTHHRYDKSHPQLSHAYVKKAGAEWQANNHDQATAWKTVETAAVLDHDAALKSCSWGMFQVMGFNHAACGYATVDGFVDAMKAGERGQLDAFVGFCLHAAGMTRAMAAKDFAGMAARYNGDDYGDYDKRIERAYRRLGGV